MATNKPKTKTDDVKLDDTELDFNPSAIDKTKADDVKADDVKDAPQAAKSKKLQAPSVVVLPVKLMENRHVLAREYLPLGRPEAIVISGHSYDVKQVQFNPHNERQEVELAELVLFGEKELETLLDQGWTKES